MGKGREERRTKWEGDESRIRNKKGKMRKKRRKKERYQEEKITDGMEGKKEC